MYSSHLTTQRDFTISESLKVGHIRGDFHDSREKISWSFFPGKESDQLEDEEQRKEISDALDFMLHTVASSYEKLVSTCRTRSNVSEDTTDLFTCSEKFNYWIRLLPSLDSYNLYIKVYLRDVSIFYYTFGSSETMPYQGGWVTVYATDIKDANDTYNKIFPKVSGDLIDCCSSYNQSDFNKSEMSVKGNLDKFNHEHIFSPNIMLTEAYFKLLNVESQEDYRKCNNCNHYFHKETSIYHFRGSDDMSNHVGCPSCKQIAAPINNTKKEALNQ